MKQTYNAASAFATIMSLVLQKVDVFEDYEEMNDTILEKLTQPLWKMQKVAARKTRMAVMVKVAARISQTSTKEKMQTRYIKFVQNYWGRQ
jgi:hypothetical protein